MRRVAVYLFESLAPSDDAIDEIDKCVARWVSAKAGVEDCDAVGTHSLTLPGGRPARLVREIWDGSTGRLSSWELTEDLPNGEFRTSIAIGRGAGSQLVTFIVLEAGQRESVVAPVSFEAKCPAVVRDILKLNQRWTVGKTTLYCQPRRVTGSEAGRTFAQEIRDPDRALPLVVLSEDSGFLVHPDVDLTVQHHVVGLANVVTLDPEASWGVTNTLGQQWSCFNGAIRLYWPRANQGSDPFQHPLWTASRLLEHSSSTEDAAKALAQVLRRKVFSAAAFALRRPAILQSLSRAAREAQLDKVLAAAEAANDLQGVVASLRARVSEHEDEIVKLTMENEQLLGELDLAITDRDNARAQLQATTSAEGASTPAEPPPEADVPPQTLAEAVERATERHGEQVLFGADVQRGVDGLRPNAGPPDKVLSWLGHLAEAGRIMRRGPLGQDLIRWLNQRGVRASDESETVLGSSSEMGRRTWDNANHEKVAFRQHLKPSEGTAPDRCVRVYFYWDSGRARFIVGWVGRHP